MDKSLIFNRSFCILSGLSGVAGVVLIMLSFTINGGPPPGVTSAKPAGSANRTMGRDSGEPGCSPSQPSSITTAPVKWCGIPKEEVFGNLETTLLRDKLVANTR
jgi:hypothetical protein